MASLNYSARLQNLQNRKFDPELKKSLLSESFGKNLIPENMEYLIESMRPIDKAYNDKTIDAANRVQGHLEKGYQLPVTVNYKTQGSVTTGTNIKVHSDFDLLTIIDTYHYLPLGVQPTNPYNLTVPEEDIVELRKQTIAIMDENYDEVDDSGEKSISIFNKALHRKVDIVFCYWYHSQEFINTGNEFYKGIQLYNFPKKSRIIDYPFAHIANVNYKGVTTVDGSKRGIRLLKNMKADGDIKLNSFQLTSIVHSIIDINLTYSSGREIGIAKAISEKLDILISDEKQRKDVKSPNGTESPLSDEKTIAPMKQLKSDLDELILDCGKEIRSTILQKAIEIY
jgi:hypothetical protein